MAVVTGGGRGLGRVVAVALARRGDRVALVGRRRGPLRETGRLIAEEGGLARAVPADVGDPAAVEAMARAVERDLGPVSILVNAAGVFGPIQPVEDGDPRGWIETDLGQPRRPLPDVPGVRRPDGRERAGAGS